MVRIHLILPFALALALAACGDEPAVTPPVADGDDADALPAPMQPAGGSITGMPDAPGPGDVPLAGDAAPPSGNGQDGLLFVDGMALPPIPDADGTVLSPLRDAAPGQFAGAEPGALPPLEDNPEAGLGDDGYIHVSRSPPADGAGIDLGQEAAATVRAYYDAITAGDFQLAYSAWSDGGRSSGRTPEQFAAAFQGTRIVRVSIGAPGRVEGAAGSRYVEVPVTVTSRTADGRELRQAGGFSMRSSQVEGAAPGWRIVSADLRELQP